MHASVVDVLHNAYERLRTETPAAVAQQLKAQGTTYEPIVVDGVSFNVGIAGLEGGRASSRIPRENLDVTVDFPFFSVIYFEGNGPTPEQKTVLRQQPDKMRSALELSGALAFAQANSQGTLRPIPTGQVLQNAESLLDPQDIPLKGGLWFSDNGLFFPIRSNQKNAPLFTLAQYLPPLIRHYPDIRQFVSNNPPPKARFRSVNERTPLASAEEEKARKERLRGDVETAREIQKDLMRWYLAVSHLLLDNDWHVIWRGVVHTYDYSLESFSRKLHSLPKPALKDLLKWPPEAAIDIYYERNVQEPDQTVTWDFLWTYTASQRGQKVLIRTFRQNSRKMYEKYKDAIHRSQKRKSAAAP